MILKNHPINLNQTDGLSCSESGGFRVVTLNLAAMPSSLFRVLVLLLLAQEKLSLSYSLSEM